MSKFIRDLKRTNYCTELSKENVEQDVTLMGWVEKRRDHGGLIFVDLRDRSGIVQVTLDPTVEEAKESKDIRNEYVIAVQGQVKARPEGMANQKMKTGEIEIIASRCEILSEAEPLPIQYNDPNVQENQRLSYRYLDLRTERLQRNLTVRHKFNQVVRRKLSENGFLEIETPILYKSTPEGARDFLVPARISPGKFFALPQSPQTLKQLLMIGGFDRYFQLARCFRDEDLRADRQPEFTQIDAEMSFVDQDDVMEVMEDLAKTIWKDVIGVEIDEIPRISFYEALSKYGSDAPDMRYEMFLVDIKELALGSGFKVMEGAIEGGGVVKGFAIPKGAAFSRSRFDKLTDTAKKLGAKGLMWMKENIKGELSSPILKPLGEELAKKIFDQLGGKPGDAVLIVADEFERACTVLGHLREELADELDLIPKDDFKFAWVVDFPLLQYDEDEERWVARHHPFTAPTDETLELLMSGEDKGLGEVKAKAYDLVCNGHEIGGGSIRIHRQEIQKAMFKALGMSPEEAQEKFGFFLEALSYGTPPHGGIAWGVDRAIMLLCKTDAIREVIAFPKTTKAYCLMSKSPSLVDESQLAELGVQLDAKTKEDLSLESHDGE
jgi:aspartyl-tRNA synthetase